MRTATAGSSPPTSGSRTASAWPAPRTHRLSGWNVFAREIDGSGRARAGSDSRPLTTRGLAMYGPRLAAAKNGFLAVWEEEDFYGPVPWAIRAARVSGSGVALDPEGIPVAAVTDVNELMVYWPAVASNGKDFLVVYYDEGRGLLARGVDAQGHLMGTEPVLVSAIDPWRPPALARVRDGYRVVWSGHDVKPPAPLHVLTMLLDDSGRPLDAQPTALATGGDLLQIASDGARSVVLWAGAGPAAGGAGLWAVRLDAKGALLDSAPFAVSPALPNVSLAGITHLSGDEYLVTWDEGPSGARTSWHTSATLLTAPASGPPTMAPLSLFDGPAWRRSPAVTSDGRGRAVVAYERLVGDPSFSGRVFLGSLARLETGGACDEAGECKSGFCVDGVCCDSACPGGDADCQACSRAAGAPADGTCAPVTAGRICRAAVVSCDLPETCDGKTRDCPADEMIANRASCVDAGAGTADAAESDGATDAPGDLAHPSADAGPPPDAPMSGPLSTLDDATAGEPMPGGEQPATGGGCSCRLGDGSLGNGRPLLVVMVLGLGLWRSRRRARGR